MRTLRSAGRRLASCVPGRPPANDLPQHLPQDPLRLSPHAVARAEAGHMVLDVPDGWAKMLIHDRDLLALLPDLATGTPAADITTTLPAEATQAVLALMDSCGLLDRGNA